MPDREVGASEGRSKRGLLPPELVELFTPPLQAGALAGQLFAVLASRELSQVVATLSTTRLSATNRFG
jgi:hypothetical protein